MAAAKEKEKEAPAAPAPEAPSAPGPSKLPIILGLVNILAVLGVGGLMIYTRLIYKRPAITENAERVRIAAAHASPKPTDAPGLIAFEPITVNIEPTPSQPMPAEGSPQQIQGKLHYVTVGFALEVRDKAQADRIEALRAILVDRMLSMLGRKGFHELITVQGRYVLRTQILELANELASRDAPGPGAKDALVSNVFFTHFTVQ